MAHSSQSVRSALSCLPGKQGRHDALPFSSWYWPAPHITHASKFEELVNWPLPHSSQVSSPFTTSFLNFPAKQAKHDVLPFTFGLRPVAQDLQLDLAASSWYVSMAHSSQSIRSARSCLPGKQGRQAVFPSSFWYSPGSQAVHFNVLELSVYCPASHSVQIISSSEFFSWNFPARQALQAVLPVPSGALPVGHVGHRVVRLTSFDAVPFAQSSQSSRLMLSNRPCLPCRQN